MESISVYEGSLMDSMLTSKTSLVNENFQHRQKNDARVYRKDMVRDERRQQKRDYKLRKKHGVHIGDPRKFHRLRIDSQFGTNILSITKNGLFTKHTNYQFLANDHNRLLAHDEKQVSPRTIERWLKRLKELTDSNGNPLISVKTTKSMHYDKLTGKRIYRSSGIEITINNRAGYLQWLIETEKAYELLRRPAQSDERAEKKVVDKISRRTRVAIGLSTGEKVLGDTIAGVKRHNCGVISYTVPFTIKDITDVSFLSKEDERELLIKEVERAVTFAMKRQEMLLGLPRKVRSTMLTMVTRDIVFSAQKKPIKNLIGYARGYIKRIVDDPVALNSFGLKGSYETDMH